ncbi:MAG: BamA/TamA family outer membrane protein [Bacteroidetes bacterium]|nr:BamA/TamA family outer membrane protein [Bacteroidota bacterium]
MKIHNFLLFAAAAVASCCFLPSCNPTKKITEGELLLDKNVVIDKFGKVDKSNMESYIKQKPNRKILFWRMYLHIYNSVDGNKLDKIKMKRTARRETYNSGKIEKYNRINAKREAKGRKAKKVPLKKKEPFIFREWWKSNGEPPVIYDSLLSKKSARQIKLFLNNKGYFNSTVKDSIHAQNKKVTSCYVVKEGTPYTIRNLSYEVKDEQLSYYVLADAYGSLIKRGINYDVDILQKERDRITSMLRNNGYFYFSKEYVYYEADTALGTHEADITLGIKNPLIKIESERDSTLETSHIRYYINNIYIYTDYDPKNKTAPKDTFFANDSTVYLLSNGAIRYKPSLLTNALFISKGELYQQSHADQTYRRLSELKLFRSVQMQFAASGTNRLNCFIYLSNIPKQSFSAETEGTNTSGTLGIAGNLVYQNKNIFKGGEIFEWKLKGALEVQKTETKKKNIIISESPLPFNTLELGTEASMLVPRFLTPFHISGTKSNNAKTNFTGMYNFQRRPDYGRSIGNLAYGYTWKETSSKQHLINPIEFNLVNIFKVDTQLQNTIDNSKDLFLKSSYSDHFTLGSRYAFIFTNQDIRKKKNFSYLRMVAEGAGNAMRGVFNLIDLYAKGINLEYKYPSFMIDSIPFSQYLRFDFDYRYYKLVNDKDKLVYRIAFGVGKPLHNNRTLPLEKSFFAGGPNSVRAWEARTLGPGGYSNETSSSFADKIGDAKIETNFEYRFNVIKALNAALFVDAGNIWLRKKYPSYPLGEFHITGDSTFIGQIAIGAGMGIRLDFNFFIIRLDGALKIKDPARKPGDRWMFGRRDLPVFNFGIGYPF